MFKALANFDFAHFAGIGGRERSTKQDLRNSAAVDPLLASEDMDDEGAKDEDEEETSEGKKGGKRGKRARKAKSRKDDDGEGDDDDGEGDDDDGEDDGDEDGDEDEEEEAEDGKRSKKKAVVPASNPRANGTDKASFKKGRKAERRRIGLILDHPAAANNFQMAHRLACNTGMSSAAAIALLEATPAPRGGRLDGRMKNAKVPDVDAGAPTAPSGDAAIAALWDTATAEYRPK